jgi:hypothetical protein
MGGKKRFVPISHLAVLPVVTTDPNGEMNCPRGRAMPRENTIHQGRVVLP